MKIIYSPFYTERPFLGKQRLFNQVVLNTRGLLAELELRAGQTAVYPSATERIVAYIAARGLWRTMKFSSKHLLDNK